MVWRCSERCKNVTTCQQCWCKKNPISDKIFAKFYAVFVKKVSNVAISRFLANTSCNVVLLRGIFCNFVLLYGLVYIFLVFWAFYAVLLRINLCHNLCTLSGKIILAPNLLVEKLCLFARLGVAISTSTGQQWPARVSC